MHIHKRVLIIYYYRSAVVAVVLTFDYHAARFQKQNILLVKL